LASEEWKRKNTEGKFRKKSEPKEDLQNKDVKALKGSIKQTAAMILISFLSSFFFLFELMRK
jgi:hypothetical protein